MKIIFTCLGFSSTDAFVIKDGRQLKIGTIWKKFPGEYEYWTDDFCMEHYVKRYGYLTDEEIPTEKQVIAEYERQYAEKGVSLNNEIVYAG